MFSKLLNDKIFQVFCTYFVLAIFVQLGISIWLEYQYYHHFNINILNISSVSELFSSQRGFTNSEKIGFVVFLPGGLSITYIILSWMREVLEKNNRRLIACTALITLNTIVLAAAFRLLPSFFPLFIFLINLLLLWLGVYHIRKLKLPAIQFHLFCAICLLAYVFAIQRLRQNAVAHVNQQPDLRTINAPENALWVRHIIQVGSTENFNIFYDEVNHRGIIFPKTTKQN